MEKLKLNKVFPALFTFIVMGFVDLVGLAVGYAKEEFNLSDFMAQWLPMAVFLWFFLLSVPVGIIQDKRGKKNTMLAGIAVTGLGMLLGFFSYSFPILLAAMVLLGIGNTIVQVAANPLIQDVTPKDKLSSYVSLGQFMKSLVPIIAPPLVSMVAKQFGNWRVAFMAFAVASLLSFLWLWFTKIDENKPERETATFASCFSLLKNPFILVMVLGIFFIVGTDVGMNTNIQNFLQTKFGMTLQDASIGISIYFVASMIARFSGAVILNWIKPGIFLLISTIIALLGLALMITVQDEWIGRAGIFLTGLGVGNLFAIIFSIAIDKMPDRSNEIAGLMVMAIVGGAVVPPIMGAISTSFGVVASLFVLVVCMVYILFAAFYVKKA